MKNRNFTDILSFFGFAAAALLIASPAAAEELVTLEGDVVVERTVVQDGSESTVLLAPEDVVPGDRLIFSTNYRNDSGNVVEDFVVTNPLPGAVVLASDKDAFQVSVDGGSSYASFNGSTVDDPQAGTRAAELADVTHIRWTLERLEPGATGSLSYSAFVR